MIGDIEVHRAARVVPMVIFSADDPANTATTRYWWPGYEGGQPPTSPPQDVLVSSSFSVDTLSWNANTAGSGTGSITWTLRKNGVVTALTLTVNPLGTTTQATTTPGTVVSFVAGVDTIGLECTKSGTITGPRKNYVTAGRKAA